MLKVFQKLPFLFELFINGSFILLYSLKKTEKIPSSWNIKYVNVALEMMVWLVPMILLFVVIVNYISSSSIQEFIRRYIFSLIVFIPLVITWGDIEFSYWLCSAHLLSSVLTLYDNDYENPVFRDERPKAQKTFFDNLQFRPAQIVLFSFFGLITVGTFLLMLPVSSRDGSAMSFIDALFMATSATCVTGLATLSLVDNFSLFGQIVILILIQIGGLGIMTLSSSMTILLGRSMGMKDRIVMQDLLDVSSQEELLEMIIDIIKYTFIIELWGGIILTIGFTFEGFEFSKAIYYGFFHSISAFCNAGFSLFNDSLESFATSPIITTTIMVLITLGGLGFIALKEIRTIIARRRSITAVGLHTKIVVVTTLILTFAGAVLIFFGEFLNALDGFSVWDKIHVSLFQSVTLRTAGFNTIPFSNLESHTIYFMSLFMFIGASPGSTGGGIKTTTFAILVQSIKSTLYGRNRVEMFERTIPNPMIVRATALSIISMIVTTSFIFILMVVEKDQTFLSIFFEVISAGGTVGLTLGITPYLTLMGKLAISALMFVGRVGPLTLVLAIGEREKLSGKFDYPEGRLMIG